MYFSWPELNLTLKKMIPVELEIEPEMEHHLFPEFISLIPDPHEASLELVHLLLFHAEWWVESLVLIPEQSHLLLQGAPSPGLQVQLVVTAEVTVGRRPVALGGLGFDAVQV